MYSATPLTDANGPKESVHFSEVHYVLISEVEMHIKLGWEKVSFLEGYIHMYICNFS